MGGTTVFMMVPYRAVIQRETPPDRIARVVAAGEAIMIARPDDGALHRQRDHRAAGVGAPFFIGGALLTLVGIAGLFSRV